MKAAKPLLFILILVATGVTTLLFLRRDPEFQVDLAKEAFLLGNWSEARHHLDEAGAHLPPQMAKLCNGYLARAEGDIQLSNAQFESVLEMAFAENRKPAAFEAALNLSLNGYLSDDLEATTSWSAEAQKLMPTHPWTRVALAASAYLHRDYTTVRTLLDSPLPKPREVDWLAATLQAHWGEMWRQLTLAHASIEQGDLTVARELLTEEPCERPRHEQAQARLFLMGLSYARQAEEKDLQSAIPYYRLAGSYFDQLPPGYGDYLLEQIAIGEKWGAAAGRLYEIDRFDEVAYLTYRLEAWNLHEPIDALGNTIANRLILAIERADCEEVSNLTTNLDLLLPRGRCRRRIARNLTSRLDGAIASSETATLGPLLHTATTFADSPDLISTGVAHHLAAQIPLGILTDDPLLRHTTARLDLWRECLHTEQEAADLAHAMVAQCRYLPADALHTEQIRRALTAAAALPFSPADREAIIEEMGHCLTTLRTAALAQDDAGSLLTWERIADYLGVVILESTGIDEIANLLADGDYLYRVGRYREALERAILACRADGHDPAANRLTGLCCHALGESEEAISRLSNLEPDDWEGQEILALSLIDAGRQEEGISALRQLAAKRVVTDQSYTALASAAISEHNAEEALSWLGSILEPDATSHLLRFYAQGVAGLWSDVARTYHNLPADLQQSAEVNAFLATGYLNQDKVGLARKAVTTALHAERSSMPIDLIEADPAWAAARLAYEVDSLPEAAIAALNNLNYQTDQSRLFGAKIHLEVGNLDEAERLLLLCDDEGECATLLCETFERMGLVEDAALLSCGHLALLEPANSWEPACEDAACSLRQEWQERPGRLSPLMRYARTALFSDPPYGVDELLAPLQCAAERFDHLPELHYLLGRAEELSGLSPLSAYERAAELYPNYLAAWQALARFRKGKEAAEALRKVVQLAPSDGMAWDRLGDWHLSQGDLEEANECWDRSIKAERGERWSIR